MRSLVVVLVLAACTRPQGEKAVTLQPIETAPTAPAPAAPRPPRAAAIVREEVAVVVAGKTERWRLEWREPPTPECMDETAFTCLCEGIELGEEGALDLVRDREGEPEDRFHLDSVYAGHTARLPRWKVLPSDDVGKAPSPAEVQRRPVVSVLQVADYDHDGRATEASFVVDHEACGHSPTLLVGLTAQNPKLHVIASVEAPNEPVLLERRAQWDTVRTGSWPIEVERVGCGDHGSTTRTAIRFSRDAAGLHAKETQKPCP